MLVLSLKSWSILENTFFTYALNLCAGGFLTHRIGKMDLEPLQNTKWLYSFFFNKHPEGFEPQQNKQNLSFPDKRPTCSALWNLDPA